MMRRILEVLDRFGHPVGIVTKSVLVRATRHPRAHGQAQPRQVARGDHARSQTAR
jgi:hypothetical protein